MLYAYQQRKFSGLIPVCSQKCINLIASRPGDIGYRCECAAGFDLINGTWCKATVDGEASLFKFFASPSVDL